MEKLRRVVTEIAYSRDHSKLPSLHRSLLPFLSLASAVYGLALSLRHHLYHFRLFSKHRLPVPVISVGNLTWGGNGKTPMVEFIAALLADSGISPLILTRGYAGGDEARMLQRRLIGKSANVGVGTNRAATAAAFIEQYGYRDPRTRECLKGDSNDQKLGEKAGSYGQIRSNHSCEEIGAAILDDGMQHWQLSRDLDIVMVNGLCPWGNHQLLPLGPLREPLTALWRANIAVIHNADLVPEQTLASIESAIREVNKSIGVFFTSMAPSYFFDVGNMNSVIPLEAVSNNVVLCVSAIGSADAFVKSVEKLGAIHIERLDFSDHHLFQTMEIEMIKKQLEDLETKFSSKPIVIVTEKDYDRDPEILKHLSPYKSWALSAKLQFVPHKGCSGICFKNLLEELLQVKLSDVPHI
ncbi:probable tetraacyldisaccharide 4'-kinase, mitochondrial [Rhodamnia argentea]|uniref:tetraacyldisaccharide 4'-kinase n=1 Tax=Rhodamnia argentea TaxID=178133 RepID=A0A8B8R1A7_9MYRT|nr:probable tetraacyldisaccharide 4'-kinase, mitochondrial [Rhodamnia argentea]XP_048130951.1 probable tetraacyldisaccharide 4'-kinase, mitochondrial [Rhodamnia argentea]